MITSVEGETPTAPMELRPDNTMAPPPPPPRKTWKQPFMQARFSPKDVNSVLAHTRPFRLGKELRSSCMRELADAREETTPTPRVRQHDYWGREDFVRPSTASRHQIGSDGLAETTQKTSNNGGVSRSVILFVNDTNKSWEKARLDAYPAHTTISKKKRLDALTNAAYRERVLSDPSRHITLTHMFHDLARKVLTLYCQPRGLVYGRDIFIVGMGGAYDCVPGLLRDTGTIPREVFPPHLYDVVASDVALSSSPDRSASVVLSELQTLMIHVVYAVEKQLRLDNMASHGLEERRDGIWTIPRNFIEEHLLPRFRTVDHNISNILPACPANGAPRKDCAMWQLRDDRNGFEGVVVKPVDCLVWSNADRNDESTVQGMRRKTMSECCPESSLYVSGAWPLDEDGVQRDDDDSAGAGGDLRRIGTADENDACRIKLKYDLKVQATPQTTESSSMIDAPDVRCGADVLTVRVLGANNPKRARDVFALSTQQFGSMHVQAFVCIDGIMVPTPYYAWVNETETFFGWLNNPRTMIDPETARNKIARVIWTTVALDIDNVLKLTGWPWDAWNITGDSNAAAKNTIQNLDTLTCSLNVCEEVRCKSVESLSPPFSYVYQRILHACEQRDCVEHREWIRTLAAGSCIAAAAAVSARLARV